jgi:hypothetical protein
MTKFIYEIPVYCGRQKHWRVLNLNSGTVYSTDYQTEEEALGSIEAGSEGSGKTVVALGVFEVRRMLDEI